MAIRNTRGRHEAPRAWKQYTHIEMHDLLLVECGSSADRPWTWAQALVCPYYVPLEGRVGADWGVILNPESTRFAQITFEHADCGCPRGADETEDGYGRHPDAPNQDGDMWDTDWKHECSDWCDTPCEVLEMLGE